MMKILSSELLPLMDELDFSREEQFDTDEMNDECFYWIFLENFEDDIIEKTGATIDTVLYSKYFHACTLVRLFEAAGGFDAGMEQQCDDILGEITERAEEEVDWPLLQEWHYSQS